MAFAGFYIQFKFLKKFIYILHVFIIYKIYDFIYIYGSGRTASGVLYTSITLKRTQRDKHVDKPHHHFLNGNKLNISN